MVNLCIASVTVVYYYLLLLNFANVTVVDSSKCIPVDHCQCRFEERDYGINLNGVNTTDSNSLNATGRSVIFNPCSVIDLNAYHPIYITNNKSIANFLNSCGNTSSACLVAVDVLMINLGPYTQFQFLTEGDQVSLTSTYNDWSYTVRLNCSYSNITGTDPKSIDKVEILSFDKNVKTMELSLTSAKACVTKNVKQEEGKGWKTFFIILFVAAFVYFVGGMVFKKIMFDASGFEMIPNHLFWINLCSSIKDIFLYCMNGCKHPSPYDQI